MKTFRVLGSVNYRAEGENMPKQFGGIAAVVDVTTDLKYFEERIERGAFDNALKKDYDIRCLFNHESECILGRTKANTCNVYVNTDGNLEYTWIPDYENPLHMQVARSIMRGDITQSSFAFTVKNRTWEKSEKYGDLSLHVIKEIDELYDVSPVTYPAYVDTEAEARSLENTKPKKQNESDQIEILKTKYK